MSTGYKDFTVIHDWSGWQATVRIQQDAETLESMREMLLFWSDGEQRIEDAEGDITEAWLVMFGETALTATRGRKLETVKYMFERTAGWAPLDGSCGIELLKADCFETDPIDFTIVTTETTDKECASC
jgi:hypothetical protein